MSLYHEAARVLQDAIDSDASIKSVVYGRKGWKSDTKLLFALSYEAAKWSEILSEVIERSGILVAEKQLTPALALVLVHDFLLSRRGVVLPVSHGLSTAVSKYKARLSAELTKARLRRGFATLDALRSDLQKGSEPTLKLGSQESGKKNWHPRWIRINSIKTTLDEQLRFTFANYTKVNSIQRLLPRSAALEKTYCVDLHIPDLIAIPPDVDMTTCAAYRDGKLILQDKASCFPAYLMNPVDGQGDFIDACAAPGNKTTHLASLLWNSCPNGETRSAKIFACEKDPKRSETLQSMVRLAGADKMVIVTAKQDFTRLDPQRAEFANVIGILLDPSCSGSGIIGREGAGLDIHLPKTAKISSANEAKQGKKRKHSTEDSQHQPQAQHNGSEDDGASLETPTQDHDSPEVLKTRLTNLSAFQLRLLQHAMSFPAARRITYSTCSVHAEENEHVVVRALNSEVARKRGWEILTRKEQVSGLREWHLRGWKNAVEHAMHVTREKREEMVDLDVVEIAEGCIRCEKGGEDGTMGFFVAGFVRTRADENDTNYRDDMEGDSEEEWAGFSDEN